MVARAQAGQASRKVQDQHAHSKRLSGKWQIPQSPSEACPREPVDVVDGIAHIVSTYVLHRHDLMQLRLRHRDEQWLCLIHFRTTKLINP